MRDEMPIVAGIDFGTLSVRVSLFDSEKGKLGSATASYPLSRKKENPDHASQRHEDHMQAMVAAMRDALANANVAGREVLALAIATTGSTVVPVDEQLRPLDDYYLWCDHRGKKEAEEIANLARRENLPALPWSGGACSSEMALPKLLHWLRNNPAKRAQFATMIEHCDLALASLTGVKDISSLQRSVCAAGHKWMWNADLGGLPPEKFLSQLDPLLAGVRKQLGGCYATSDKIAGHLSPEWADNLGLRAGIPIPVGAIDAHWDAIGAGISVGDVVNVVGTSTCVMAIVKEAIPIPGVFGVVQGSVHPHYAGIEAGLSAVGDIFEAIARRADTSVSELSRGLETFRAGQTGLLRMTWDNGDRNVLSNPALGGVTFGWNLLHTAQDELFAAIEGTAFHTRIILERVAEHGVPIERVIHGGGIPQKNETLNQVYANVFNKPVLVPTQEITGLGSGIFAFLAGGVFKTVEEAQKSLCPPYRTVTPQPEAVAIYEKLFLLYRRLYFSMGTRGSDPVALGDFLPALTQIAAGR
ncbi:MAG: araB [Verrucomicrobiales bacterium]|nr:araB [Verrucomicrobiales bacterium]